MLVPAGHALALDDHRTSRAFAYAALPVLVLALFLWLPLRDRRLRNPLFGQFRGFILAYAFLPPILALPFAWAVPQAGFMAAWWEMVSCLTTTGASIFPPGDLPQSVHLWRGIAGWGGGFLILVAAAGILAPLNIGGFEVLAPRSFGRARLEPTGRHSAAAQRLRDHALALFPAYGGITLALWAGLHAAGDNGLVSLMHAMAAISTSGITPLSGLETAASGRSGEALILLVLLLAISRRLLPGQRLPDMQRPLARDPELRAAAFILSAAALVLFAHHMMRPVQGSTGLIETVWGIVFTTLSFLTTTGFQSADWVAARPWVGVDGAGLALLGLCMIGGGIATTAGGVTLLRVYALYSLCRREMERLSEPSSIGGGGSFARQTRQEGAFIAFVFFALFALTLGAINLALATTGMDFETAMAFSVSALSTTGDAVTASGIATGWNELEPLPRGILALGMILGRLETLALLAFILPSAWRQ